MRGIVTHSPHNPDFARVVTVAMLRRGREFAFDIAPDGAETARLARLFDARFVRKMRFEGMIRTDGPDLVLEAGLGATVGQTCVVTLEPVTTRIDVGVRRRFVPMEEFGSEIDVSPEDDDEIEPLEDRIDLGLVAIEALALALPAYPRKEGAAGGTASSAPAGAGPLEEEAEARPFASLAALRERLERKE